MWWDCKLGQKNKKNQALNIKMDVAGPVCMPTKYPLLKLNAGPYQPHIAVHLNAQDLTLKLHVPFPSVFRLHARMP